MSTSGKMLGWLRRSSKYAIAAGQYSIPGIKLFTTTTIITTARSIESRVSVSPISRNLGFKFQNNQWISSSRIGRRYYCSGPNQVQGFRRGKWYQNGMIAVGLVTSCGFVFGVYSRAIEKRILPKAILNPLMECCISLEKRLGEIHYRILRRKSLGCEMEEDALRSIRVRKITEDIIRALNRGLNDETFWSAVASAYGDDDDGKLQVEQKRRWVQEEFEPLKWEVSVMLGLAPYILTFPDRKIVLSYGLFTYIRTDAGIAALIGRQVWLQLTHRLAEEYTAFICCAAFLLGMLGLFLMPALALSPASIAIALSPASLVSLFLIFFPRWRIPKEANIVGGRLMASAGYTLSPNRSLPKVFEVYDFVRFESGR